MSEIGVKTRIPVNDSVFAKDDPGVGQTLITALANFIIPLIQGGTTPPGIGTNASYTPSHPIGGDESHSADDAVHPGLTVEGQELLIALKQFAGSLARPPNGEQTEQQLPGNFDQLQVGSDGCRDVQPLNGWDAHMWESSGLGSITADVQGWDENMWKLSGLGLIVTEADMERQQVIKEYIDKASSKVFNEMPIRLLMFDEHGKGITLVERSQVMEYISAEINSCVDLNFNKYGLWQFSKYAILSHTWLPRGEVTYSEWKDHAAQLDTQSPGYRKLAKFCKEAAKYGLRLAWMDTVCINKESSSELDESIRSMFKWYQKANICIVYLAETTSLNDMEKDKWFTRGWTLQELLAPRDLKFFSKNWTTLSNSSSYADFNDKDKGSPLMSKICDATGLTEKEVSDSPFFFAVPLWRKMQWAAGRKVTREEDTAYSLMGIFDISMPIGYGEGAEHAFLRLIREILSSNLKYGKGYRLMEIMNWNSEHREFGDKSFYDYYSIVSPSALIPQGPYAYMYSNRNIDFYLPFSPITLSHMGLCVPVLLMPSKLLEKDLDTAYFPKGDYSATFEFGIYICNVLDGALFSSESSCGEIAVIAVLNIADQATHVLLPENGLCLAASLEPIGRQLERWEIPEDLRFRVGTPGFTFKLIHHHNSPFQISKEELSRHGMTLRTMHLWDINIVLMYQN